MAPQRLDFLPLRLTPDPQSRQRRPIWPSVCKTGGIDAGLAAVLCHWRPGVLHLDRPNDLWCGETKPLLVYRRVVCPTTMPPYRVSFFLRRTPLRHLPLTTSLPTNCATSPSQTTGPPSMNSWTMFSPIGSTASSVWSAYWPDKFRSQSQQPQAGLRSNSILDLILT